MPDDPDFLGVLCSQAVDLLLGDVVPNGLILPVAHEDGLVKVPILQLLFLVLGQLRAEEANLLLEEGPLFFELFFLRSQLYYTMLTCFFSLKISFS